MTDVVVDPHDATRALAATGLLETFNAAGVLAAADVHVARRLAQLGGADGDEPVQLAVALAVRATRLGHVCVDLTTIAETAAVDVEMEDAVDLSGLPWPEPAAWLASVAASPLTASGAAPAPLRLEGGTAYLDRYWREERQVAEDLRALAVPAEQVDAAALAEGVRRLFGDDAASSRQAQAAATSVLRRLAVVAGGPGTGKTTTIGQIAALLVEQAAARGTHPPAIALAAPTGKAAARLAQAIGEQADRLPVDPAVAAQLRGLRATTLHRLLGWRLASHSRFRHHRGNRLPHDVVIVDETSMVSLSLMARLIEAIRDDARLILVGDPGQLTSVEAGAVLGDLVAPGTAIADGVVVLDRVHRFGTAIASVAEAVRAGDAAATIAALRGAPEHVTWIEADAATAPAAVLAPVRAAAVGAARAAAGAAAAGEAERALEALGAFRLLCAHRHGPHGVGAWSGRVERWLADAVERFDATGEWYVGRPLLVTRNDPALRLSNGDTGIVVAEPGTQAGLTAAFERAGEVVRIAPARLEAVETVYAMTVHKSQGSQFATAAVVLPDPGSPLLTRELLYTAATRAQQHLMLVGTEEALVRAVERPIARASGLRGRLRAEGQ